MNALRDISIIWSLTHTLVMFLALFDSRYPKKNTIVLTCSSMIPLILINLLLMAFFGSEQYMKLMLFTLSVPSFIFFWILAKHRDGRFIFTFCMIDTLSLEIISITKLIDDYIPGHWFIFITRLIIFPLIAVILYKKFKKTYQEIQNQVKKGWVLFAIIGILFYVAITLAMSSAVIFSEHPDHIPVFVILLLLMPFSYINIFNTLKHQRDVYRSMEQESIMRIQVSDIRSRVEEYSAANASFRRERHDFRHKLQTISRLVETKNFDELMTVVSKYTESIEETKVKKYCENAVIDAVLASYIRKAESKGISVTSSVCFPEELPVNDIELATVFANAIENAINAAEKLDADNRHIEIKVIAAPKFMMQISNTFDGEVEFDEDGIPVTKAEGHGFGTRSIAAFCDKYGLYYSFGVKDERFVLQIAV